ncbi:MAG: hypothetical protein ACTH5D_05170 [Halomonas sp.]|uniref:hypothetical protein n=1 Tax=Halomonas sp. TaxID=1486246 RepID=UPI003F903262
MTDVQYENWLADLSAPRVLLVELHHADGVEYVANAPYISRPGDSAKNRIYDDLLASAVDISTRIDGLIGFGELALVDDGEITHWAQRAWQGHSICMYLGGPDWSLDDFRLLAKGRNNGISEAKRGVLTFLMSDESSVLDEQIGTGELPNEAGAVPLVLGHVFNAPAYRVATETLTYQASYLPVSTISAKDNGNLVSHTTDATAGSVELAAPLVGTITVDIEESHNTPALVVTWVADHYGIAVGDIDLPDYLVGLHYSGATTGSQILSDLCAGLGAYWYINALGELVVRQHNAAETAGLMLFADDIVYDQISLSETESPWKSLTLKWGRNPAPLTTIAAVVDDATPELASRLRREWQESRSTQSVDNYPLAENAERDSVIQDATDAATERDRLLALRSVRRELWRIEAFLPPVEIGQAIAVDHLRLAGRVGRIVSIARSPTLSTTALEVWV